MSHLGTEAIVVGTTFEKNRREISKDELKKHKGKWVAFSADGTRIVGSCQTLQGLENRLKVSGHDPSKVVFDHLVDSQTYLGGAEFL
jgi:hypothetical protein